MKLSWTTFLLVLFAVSVMDASGDECHPCNEYRLMFQNHTTTDYAILENAINDDLSAMTVCFFVRDTDDNKPANGKRQCLYSYAAQNGHNKLNVLTTPSLRVLVNGRKGFCNAKIDYKKWNHICITWNNANGDYNFYKDGEPVCSGTGLSEGQFIPSGGTAVIGQDQDTLGGGFDADQSFVGDVTEVNVWGTVLPEENIVMDYHGCNIKEHGSAVQWSQFKDRVYGEVLVVEP